MDAVEGTLQIRNEGARKLSAWSLDVNGKRTGKIQLAVSGDTLRLNLAAANAAVYYEIGAK